MAAGPGPPAAAANRGQLTLGSHANISQTGIEAIDKITSSLR